MSRFYLLHILSRSRNSLFPTEVKFVRGKDNSKGLVATSMWVHTAALTLSSFRPIQEQSANKTNCLEEQLISVPSMSVKGKGRLITCAKEQFWALRPNAALFMCWENSLAYRGDCPQTTSGECSLQRFISCTLRSTWEECQLASAKIMPGTVLTLHKYIYHSASVTTECANKGIAYFSLQVLALHLLRTRQKRAHHKRAERRGPKKGLQEEAAAMGSRIIHQSQLDMARWISWCSYKWSQVIQ